MLTGGRLSEAFRHAIVLDDGGAGEKAAEQCRRILGIEPDNPHALHLLGLIAARNRERLDEGFELVGRALALAPESGPESAPERAMFCRTLAEIERRRFRHDQALALARQAVALEPQNHLAHVTEGCVLRDVLRLDEAMACQRRAIALAPDYPEAHFELGKSLLLLGRFAEGWAEYEWRFRLTGAAPLMPPIDCPAWDGSPIDGTLVLIGDQGFGDVIQFARYIPWAAARAGDVAVAASPEMRPLLAGLYPGLRLFTRWPKQPDFQAFCALSGLPRLHGSHAANIPPPLPRLAPEADLAASWRARLAAVIPTGHRRIGIAWAGRPTHNNDINRSATIELFAPLAARERIMLVSLQKGPAAVQAAGFRAAPLLNLAPALEDFRDTVAVIAALDLVITVDTVIAHLAGAMGCPVWIALPYAPDWRWLLGRDDSPWYASARLFRQPAPGRWDAVATDLAAALAT